MIFILGGKGFVGQAYARYCLKNSFPFEIITRENYESFIGKKCSILINANGNSKKFLANEDPIWEFEASVTSVVKSLEDIKSDHYIYLSTGDVYEQHHLKSQTDENHNIDRRKVSRYGLHKLTAEDIVKTIHPSHLIIRMGGFVGTGMKKNAIYDLINNQPVWLHPKSHLQFINTDSAATIVYEILNQNIYNETINIGATGKVKIEKMHTRLDSKSEYIKGSKQIHYELNTDKLSKILGKPLPTSEDEVEEFFLSIDR